MNITARIHRPRAGQEEENIARIMEAYGIIMLTSMHPAPSNPIFTILQPRLNRAGHHYRCGFFVRDAARDCTIDPHMETIYSVPKDDPHPPRPAEVFSALLEEARMMDAVLGTPEPPRDLYIETWYPHLAYSPCEDEETAETRGALLDHIYTEQRDFRYLLEIASPEDDQAIDPDDPNVLYRYFIAADLRLCPEDIPAPPHASITLDTTDHATTEEEE